MPLTKIQVGALNIAADPHPKGVYREILARIADKEVELWGSDKAKITPFRQFEDNENLLALRILVWAEIDPDGKWINKRKNIEATDDEKLAIIAALPGHIEPNFRSFNAIFVEDKHLLVLEYRNELGEHLAASRAERLFERLFGRYLTPDDPDVAVTAVPQDDALEKIFAIDRLRRLEIVIKRPNADDVLDDATRILQRMKDEGTGERKTELIKAPRVKSITPDATTKKLAKIASTNGHVTGEGRDAKRKKTFVSTKEHPKVEEIEVPENTASYNAFLSVLRRF